MPKHFHFAFPRGILAGFSGLVVLIAVGILAWIFLPKAQIKVSPVIVERAVEQQITLSALAEEPDFVKFVLPGRVLIKEVTEQQLIKRGNGEAVEDFAKGVVTMINLQPDEQRLLPKTHLKHESSGTFFLTDTAAIIPPEGEVEVSVTAKTAGESGNVKAGKFLIDKLPVSVQARVYAEGKQSMSGGLIVEQPLTETERKSAEEAVLKEAKVRLLGELTSAAGGALLREDLTTFIQKEMTVSAEVGSRASEFSVRVVVEAKSFMVDENDLLSLTLLNLRGAAEAGEEFVTYDPQTFSANLIRSDFERGEAVVAGSLTGSFATKLGAKLFTPENIAGLTANEVQERLGKLPGVGNVEVLFSPFWVRSVPSRPQAVEIIFATSAEQL